MWAAQRAAFGARYRLVIPDLRGHGRTDNPDGLAAMNHRQFSRDITGLCQALEIEQAIFCGLSTGAMLLLTLGLEAPDLARALVLSGCTYYYGEELRAWLRAQTPETLVTSEEWGRELQAAHTALGPDHWRMTLEAWIALSTHAHGDDFPNSQELEALRAPVLIVHGDRDQFFPVEVPATLYGLLPNAELCLLPHTGHGPPVERAEWFNEIVLDFLTRRT
jgi:pimeloyl-ACP methyl ester carboxylesterase